MELNDLLTAVSLVIAAVALILSIVIARLALSQTEAIHLATHQLSFEAYDRERFESMYGACGQLLECTADLKADLLPYWKGESWLKEHLTAPEREELLTTIHRSIERLSTRRRLLHMALQSLPAHNEIPSSRIPDAIARVLREVDWLKGSAMVAYLALVGEDFTQTPKDSVIDAVVHSIRDQLPGGGFENDHVAIAEFTETRRNDENALSRARASGGSPEQVADSYLQVAEESFANSVIELAIAFDEGRKVTANSATGRRRRTWWLAA